MQQLEAPSRHHVIPAIDGLRTVAVLLVFFVHVEPGVFPGGAFGVDIFFVISGFLITSLLLREAEQSSSISLSNFYRRRLLRIVPASLFCSAVIYFCFPDLISTNEPGPLVAAASVFSFMNWLRAYTDITGGALGHYWSLAVEEQFYALWSIAIATLVYMRQTRFLVSAALALWIASMAWRGYLTFSGAEPSRIYNGLDSHVDGLLLGCILAKIVQVPALLRLSRFWPIPSAGLVVSAITVGAESEHLWVVLPLVSLLATWIVICSLNGDTIFARLLSAPLMAAAGKRSYSFYLWHFPILLAFFNSPYPRKYWLLPCFALSWAAAHLSYTFIEGPFLSLKNRKRSVATI